jgi:hypothetical protein
MLVLKILPGLPPYGERAISFPRPGAFREGLVVEFQTEAGRWVGNFARWWDGLESSVHAELGAGSVVIVAAGAGYVVDAVSRTLVHAIGTDVRRIWYAPKQGAMIVSNDLWFEAFDGGSIRWRSRRLSWDGMRDVLSDGARVTGRAYSPIEDDWTPFELDLESGIASGGSYNGPEM